MSEARRFHLSGFLRRYWPYGLALGAAAGLLNFTYFYLDDVTRGVDSPMREPFIEEMTAAFGVAALIPFVVWLALRFPMDRSGRLARLPAQLIGVVIFSAAHTFWNWGTRVALFPLAGLGTYDYGAMPVRFFMEFPSDFIIYVLTLVITYLVVHYRQAQAQQVAFSRLETRLARAQLDNLWTRLQPHFLFNTLNTVSSVMYEDPAAADAVLTRLGDLLRLTMDGGGAQEVPLAREIEALEMYLDIMRARFGERLQVTLEVEPEARAALVPTLLLQPLVENAVRHGEPAPPRPARIRVSAARQGSQLVIQVVDNGPGFLDPVAARRGDTLGLPNTAARLDQLYGGSATLKLENRADGGARVQLTLPFRQSDDPKELAGGGRQALPSASASSTTSASAATVGEGGQAR